MTQEQIQNQPHVKKAYYQMRAETGIKTQREKEIEIESRLREKEIESRLDDLFQERERLIQRIKEIDAQLFGAR